VIAREGCAPRCRVAQHPDAATVSSGVVGGSMPEKLGDRIRALKSRSRSAANPTLGDEARFIRTWLESPRLTGAVSPSGRFLARAMARAVEPGGDGLVVELGPGTGPVTRALIERGIRRDRLVLVEYEPSFCRLLAQRFPGVRVIQGDAFRLSETLEALANEPIRAVVSSLPLLNQSPGRRLGLVEEALRLTGPGGLFVQFTYGMVSPIPRLASLYRFTARASAPVWLNVPPARVWTYRADPNAMPEATLLSRLRDEADRIGDTWSERADEAGRRFRARRAAFGAKIRAHARGIVADVRRERAVSFLRDRKDRE
jgi:phosphatidylethanolamine/phosphatidyl-N-methylethanolamine N-methyltransferase